MTDRRVRQDRQRTGEAPHEAASRGVGRCVVFAVLFLLAYFLLQDVPDASATTEELREYYTNTNRRAVVFSALYLVSFSGLAGGRELLLFGQATLMVFGLRSAGVFMIATATRIAKAGVVPRWFRLISIAGALVLMFSASYLVGLVLILPVWVGLVSLLVLFRDLSKRHALVA